MDVGKGGAKRPNHLFKTFASRLLARKRVEFQEINGHQIVRPLKLTLINDFLNKADDHVLFCTGSMGFLFSELLELCQSFSGLNGSEPNL